MLARGSPQIELRRPPGQDDARAACRRTGTAPPRRCPSSCCWKDVSGADQHGAGRSTYRSRGALRPKPAVPDQRRQRRQESIDRRAQAAGRSNCEGLSSPSLYARRRSFERCEEPARARPPHRRRCRAPRRTRRQRRCGSDAGWSRCALMRPGTVMVSIRRRVREELARRPVDETPGRGGCRWWDEGRMSMDEATELRKRPIAGP